ncbi:MAG TPA: nucleotide sugar dehydrogenase [Rubrobacteraceae bacterium]|nr:nucleotide sugar dehydrogenase [Rubrobacteraceae bacterium]
MMSPKDRTVSVVGLGYAGLQVAVAFGKAYKTVGFDINPDRIRELANGFDRSYQVSPNQLKAAGIVFTNEIADLEQADFHVVAVPTPVDVANQPDLSLLLEASETVGKALKPGDIVIYESTVYPGATEEECVPVLERVSGLRCGVDFKVGYSPERINPGDERHTFTTIVKVVSGQDDETLDVIARMYGSVVEAGVHRVSSIKAAEAAKVIENIQRDLNIALMNELALIFDRMDVDTNEVLKAAGTKWNFHKYQPGLVGGHCIGIDPYYLTHKAERLGYMPEVILAGRRINDSMGRFVAQRTIKEMIRAGHNVRGNTVTVLGLTFKDDLPDLRNSKVVDIIRELEDYGVNVQVHDEVAEPAEAERECGIYLKPWRELRPAAAVVVAVAHRAYRVLPPEDLTSLFAGVPVLIDVKGIFDAKRLREAGVRAWRL